MFSLQTLDLFFGFPGEIQGQILGYLLTKPKVTHINQTSDLINPLDGRDEEDDDYGPSWPLNYFLMSQTFHREATAVYLRENTFHILSKGTRVLFNTSDTLRGHHGRFGPLSMNVLLANAAWSRARQRIRNNVAYMQRPRAFLDESVYQPLLDMIQAGGLEALEFRVGFKARGRSVCIANLMRSMNSVLANTDLVVANQAYLHGIMRSHGVHFMETGEMLQAVQLQGLRWIGQAFYR